MSITQQLLRNALQNGAYGGRLNFRATQLKNSARGLHSVLLKPSASGLRRSQQAIASIRLIPVGGGSVGSNSRFGRSTASVFIISRNESTNSNSILSNPTTETAKLHSGLPSKCTCISQDLYHDRDLGTPQEPVTTAAANADQSISLNASAVSSESGSEAVSHQVLSSTEPVEATSQALIFESIPEPPAIPLQELAGDIVGEPSLASLGLGGWSPSGVVQQCLEYFHVGLGMPWWASILTGTIIIRVLLLPLVIKSQKNAAKMQNNMPQLQLLQAKMTEARQTGNALLSAKYGQDMMLFMKEKDISPFKSMLVPLAMAPVFISCFFGIRKMANLPVESMKEGGLFWFVDLTVADPLYLLPLITSLTVWVTLEIGADGMKVNATHGNLVKYFMRAIPLIMFPFTLNFPAAILCYWVSTNGISLIQVSMLKIPAIRDKLNIERARTITPDMLPVKKKGFRESFKESWTNMKITREIEDRQRYDEISFKRAGRGPIPKTFKYDPTKVDPLKDAAAAVQAKRK